MKVLILIISVLFTSQALALPSKKEPEVKNSMELFNQLQSQPREDQPVQGSVASETQQQEKAISKIQQAKNGRIWSLDKIVKKFKPEDVQQALLDISLESAPEKSQKMKVFKVTRVAAGSIYDQAGVKVGDYAAQ